MSWQHMPTQFIVYTPDLEQSGQHNTIQAHPKTDISLWATLLNTLMRQADTAAHRRRVVGVTARYHNFILPLPAQLLTVIVTESDAQTLQASTHAQHMHTQTYLQYTPKLTGLSSRWCHCFSMWLIVRLLDGVVNWADRNKHISYKKLWQCLSLNLSQAAWRSARRWRPSTEFHVYVIGIHLVYLSWHRNKVIVPIHKCLYYLTCNVRS